jgi:cold shock protein
MRTGTLKWFDEAKGYGFISPADGGEDVFVRKSAFEDAGVSTSQGQTLGFEVVRTDEGLQAKSLSSADA